jgi:hypothetical protein
VIVEQEQLPTVIANRVLCIEDEGLKTDHHQRTHPASGPPLSGLLVRFSKQVPMQIS